MGSCISSIWWKAEDEVVASALRSKKGKAQRHQKRGEGKVSGLEIVHIHASSFKWLAIKIGMRLWNIIRPCLRGVNLQEFHY